MRQAFFGLLEQRRFVAIFITAIIVVMGLAYVVNVPETLSEHSCATGYKGGNRTINCYGTCAYISGTGFFVPTRVASEWQSFLSKPPGGAFACIGTGCSGCGAATSKGHRWYCRCDGGVAMDIFAECNGNIVSSNGWDTRACSSSPPANCWAMCRSINCDSVFRAPNVSCSTVCNNSGCA